jgi:hypothetical protein
MANSKQMRASDNRWTTPAETIASLSDLPRAELVRRWEAIYGSPPPHTIKRPLLERALSWHLQAKVCGSLPAKAMRDLVAIGGGGKPASERADGQGPMTSGRTATAGPMTPGTRLLREWGGRTHSVDVTATGFRWNGEEHRSLSAIARKITGARWSGPRFFGI